MRRLGIEHFPGLHRPEGRLGRRAFSSYTTIIIFGYNQSSELHNL